MILDENFEMKITPVKVSHAGDFVMVDTLEFRPTSPKMAKAMFTMKRHFSRIQKEALASLTKIMGTQELKDQQALSLEAGEPSKALHEQYADDDEAAREQKLKDIDIAIEEINHLIDMSTDVDLFKVTEDFSKMVIDNKRCLLKGKDAQGNDFTENMTASVWSQQIEPDDRVSITVRYCSFFGLTSNSAN